jgi:hypothetical protein
MHGKYDDGKPCPLSASRDAARGLGARGLGKTVAESRTIHGNAGKRHAVPRFKVQGCRRGIYSASMCVITILQGLLTPLIAMIATYIAWQQWQGNKQKLKMDGYERRLRVYQEVVKMLKQCANGEIREFPIILAFGAATAEADFLFGPEIRQYLDEISRRAANLRSANVQFRDFKQSVPAGYDHETIVKEIGTQTDWFVEQLVGFVAKNKFGKYLNIAIN